MTRKHLSLALAAISLLLIANMACATDASGNAAAKPAAAKASAPTGKLVHKVAPRGKLVDINSANKAALKKLPGITDADADKIIANRPYGSKTWLLGNKVLESATYYGISDLLVAKQPFKTAAENAAFYDKLKKNKAAKP